MNSLFLVGPPHLRGVDLHTCQELESRPRGFISIHSEQGVCCVLTSHLFTSSLALSQSSFAPSSGTRSQTTKNGSLAVQTLDKWQAARVNWFCTKQAWLSPVNLFVTFAAYS